MPGPGTPVSAVAVADFPTQAGGAERTMITDKESAAYHRQALAGSRTLSGDLWKLLHEPMCRALRRKFASLDGTDIQDAVTDVILGYVEHPAQYQPDRLPLDRYLLMAARSDLLNWVHSEQRRPQMVPFDPVAHDVPDRNSEQEAEERAHGLEASLPSGETWETVMRTLFDVLPDPVERAVWELMVDGVRDSRRFAQVLGYSDREPSAQRHLVKRAKDRIRVRLKRRGVMLRRDEG